MLRDFFRGFIKIHILYHVSRQEVYGVQFIAELARHGYHLSPGTLYPLLHSLEESRYVERKDRIVDGKVRKYYRITRSGRKALQQARARMRELVDEVLEEVPATVTAA
jgi:DNA-binding PadR family transcriptional regulator